MGQPLMTGGKGGAPVQISYGQGSKDGEPTPDRPIYAFNQRPETPLWSSFIPAQDPAYTDTAVSGIEDLGLQNVQTGATYGGKSFGAASDIWESGTNNAGGMRDLADRGSVDMQATGVGGASDASLNAAGLRDYSQQRLSSGDNWANDTSALGSEVSYGLAGLESGGYGTAAADQLKFARDRSLSAQKALGGTVRGLGSRQNTTMEDAAIVSDAGRNADILRAREDAAFRDRRSQALLGAGQFGTAAATNAADQRVSALTDAGNIVSSAGAVDMRGQQFQTQADRDAAQYGLTGYGAAADTLNAAGGTAAAGFDQGGQIAQKGAGNMVNAAALAGRKRDLEQRGGMAFEDFLTKRYAGALGVAGDSAASAAKKEAAIYGAIGDGVSTYFSNASDK